MARHDPAFASKQAQTYIGTADTLIAQAQDQFVANTAELLFYQYKIDNSLHALTAMYPALPRMQPRIEDVTFRMAQLRSFGRITLATVAAELGNARLDPKNRFHVERFFSLSTQTGTWIRGLFNTVLAVDPAKTPRPKALWDAFFMLDVFYQETAKEYSAYAAYVRQQVPSIAELVTPKPQSITNYQQLLKPDEALIATLVTPRDLYVWSLTRRGVSLSRKSISDREVGALVTRLRAGLTPASSGGRTTLPDFDAAAAHELYQLIFEPVAASLKDVKHVIWYGHGPLGSVPPAVLVAKKPPKALAQYAEGIWPDTVSCRSLCILGTRRPVTVSGAPEGSCPAGSQQGILGRRRTHAGRGRGFRRAAIQVLRSCWCDGWQGLERVAGARRIGR